MFEWENGFSRNDIKNELIKKIGDYLKEWGDL
jgi:hypothetical protein